MAGAGEAEGPVGRRDERTSTERSAQRGSPAAPVSGTNLDEDAALGSSAVSGCHDG